MGKKICPKCGEEFRNDRFNYTSCYKCRLEYDIEHSLKFVKSHYPDVYERGFLVINGKKWDLEELERLIHTKKTREHNCSEDMSCKACGKMLCIDCCHWSPMIYTHPDDVYCPSTCCPSCGHARSISRNPDNPIVKKFLDEEL